MNRIYAYVALALVVSLVSIGWGARGLPVSTHSAVAIAPVAPGKLSSLDQIRQDALQAATGFTLSSCDSTMKKNLIDALTAYFHAWQEKAKCPRTSCGVEQRAAAETFSTPLDMRVRTAFAEALNQPGIAMTDLPDSLRYDMFQFASLTPRSVQPSSCQPQRDRRATRSR
jgi:hypothetical protein